MIVVYKSLSFLGYPRYRIGNDGTLWSLAGRWLVKKYGKWKPLHPQLLNKNKPKKIPYYRATLHNDEGELLIMLHYLVLLAFIGPQPDGKQGAHNDGNSLNNHVSNLAWKTPTQNCNDKVLHGTNSGWRGKNAGEKNGKSTKLSAEQVLEIRLTHSLGLAGYKILGREYGVDTFTIRAIIKRKNWRHI